MTAEKAAQAFRFGKTTLPSYAMIALSHDTCACPYNGPPFDPDQIKDDWRLYL